MELLDHFINEFPKLAHYPRKADWGELGPFANHLVFLLYLEIQYIINSLATRHNKMKASQKLHEELQT